MLNPSASFTALRVHLQTSWQTSHAQHPILNPSMRLPKIQNASSQPSSLFSTRLLPVNNSHHNHCPLANFLASFFHQKIVALKESISLQLLGNPSPFDFDQPHCKELLSEVMLVTPAEVSKLLQSMSNKLSQLDYIPTSLLKSCADIFSILISHLANLPFTQATFPS